MAEYQALAAKEWKLVRPGCPEIREASVLSKAHSDCQPPPHANCPLRPSDFPTRWLRWSVEFPGESLACSQQSPRVIAIWKHPVPFSALTGTHGIHPTCVPMSAALPSPMSVSYFCISFLPAGQASEGRVESDTTSPVPMGWHRAEHVANVQPTPRH